MHPKNQKHLFTTIGNKNFTSFAYEEFGIKGVGKDRWPIINMDQYIDHSKDELLHQECCIGLAKSEKFKMGMFYGSTTPEELKNRGYSQSWSEVIRELDNYDPTGFHRQSIEKIVNECSDSNLMSTVYKYVYFAMGGIIPWFFALYLKNAGFFQKTKEGQWTDEIKNFPILKEYIETLPFKEIGRVLFFTTYPGSGIVTHRDSIVAEHSDHNINLFFSAGSRPSFIWDEVKKTKVYLDSSARSYFFNNRDYHGVDPEPTFRYTLRIDGTFTDELQKKLGLIDGYTWKWDYETQNN